VEDCNSEQTVESFLDRRSTHKLTPNGRLALRVRDADGASCRRQWADGQKLLESRLNTAVAGLVAAAAAIKAAREDREGWRRRYENPAGRFGRRATRWPTIALS